MRTRWVYQLRDRPGADDIEGLAEQEGPPRQILARRRPDNSAALVDGYILQSIDAQRRTAVYTWVHSGEPDTVAACLLELLAESCPAEQAR
ncbi:hypothetical protein ACFWA9_31995 [Kitasatospora sp. NPDC059973]|uniref:hypothetical protein n=1 Tax=Kitasatospora sp. NPDC059973 TaxID=3347020 RepID=UPI0036B5478F